MSQHRELVRWFLLKKVRICIDLRELNKQTAHPVFEDTMNVCGQSKVISKADLSSGYWHGQLDQASSLLIMSQTCFGRFKWLRFPFGTSVSSDIFQNRLLEAVKYLPGVIGIADDVAIHGKILEEQDHHLDQFIARCQEKNIELNKSKLMLRSDGITFVI